MKKSRLAEDLDNSFDSFFPPSDVAALSRTGASSLSVASVDPESRLLDGFVTAIKALFLYVPGTAAIHLIVVGWSLMFFYDFWSTEMIVGAVGVAIVAAFMVLLGLERLSNLRYLRIVGGIFAVSALSAIAYGILATLIPGDLFSLFARCTLPLPLLAGYLIKRQTDRTE